MQIHAVDSQWSGIDRSWYFTQLANYQAKRARVYEGKSETIGSSALMPHPCLNIHREFAVA